MKAVAADTCFSQIFGQREHLRQFRIGVMKAGVEADNLWDVGHSLHDDFDGRKVVWLMQRGERDELFEIGQNLLIHAHGFEVMRSSMDHAMSNADEFHATAAFAQESGEVFDRAVVAEFGALAPDFFAYEGAVAGFANEARRGVKPFDLAPKGQVESAVAPGEDREFDAGRAGVEN